MLFAIITVVQLGQIVQLVDMRMSAASDDGSRLLQQMVHNEMNATFGGALGFKHFSSRQEIDAAIEEAITTWGLWFLLSIAGVHAVVWVRRSSSDKTPAAGP
ncbi:MAG: hypothetical protein ACYC3L_13465 [Gemmatimonadaceae bacterium]